MFILFLIVKNIALYKFSSQKIWLYINSVISLHRQTTKDNKTKTGNKTLVAAYTYRNLRGLLNRWSETANKKPIKNPLKWWHH